MDRKKILIIVMIIIVTLTLIIFATAKIRAKAKEGETIIHEGENVSNTTEPTEVVIKISDDEKSKEEKEKDALKEKYDYLKNDNNGYEKKMSELTASVLTEGSAGGNLINYPVKNVFYTAVILEGNRDLSSGFFSIPCRFFRQMIRWPNTFLCRDFCDFSILPDRSDTGM